MSAFSISNPNLQLAWDSTSLAAFRRCPRFYQYTHLECWRGLEESDDLIFGIAYHESLEKYDKARGLGLTYAEAIRIALRHALCSTVKRDEATFKPWTTENKIKNRFTLVRTICWYLTQFEHDAFVAAKNADGGPAVELSFRLELPLISPEGTPYILCGHMDKVVVDGDYYQVVDRKTTKSTISSHYFNQYSPNTQMSCYSVAIRVMFNTENIRAVIDAAQVAVNFSRFHRGSTGRTKHQMDEWISDTLWWIKLAEKCATDNRWPMNDSACNLYGGCRFRPICSLDPGAREMFLKSSFVKGEQWDPLKVRGD